MNRKSVFDHLLPDEAKKTIKRNRNVIRLLKQKHIKTISSQLDKISKYEFILEGKRVVYSGDIITRPLESFKFGQHMEMLHYGIVFGLSKKSEKLVLEISSGTDISLKTLDKFIAPYTIDDVHIKRKPKDVNFEEIMGRADSLIFESYSSENLNCEQFANYCVFNKFESKGLQNAAIAASSIIDIITSWTELKIAYTPKSKQMVNIKKFNNMLKRVSRDMKKLK